MQLVNYLISVRLGRTEATFLCFWKQCSVSTCSEEKKRLEILPAASLLASCPSGFSQTRQQDVFIPSGAILLGFLPGVGHSRRPRGSGVWGRGLAELMSEQGGGSHWATGDFAASNPSPPLPPPPPPAPHHWLQSGRCPATRRGAKSGRGAGRASAAAPGHRPGRARHVGAEARPLAAPLGSAEQAASPPRRVIKAASRKRRNSTGGKHLGAVLFR